MLSIEVASYRVVLVAAIKVPVTGVLVQYPVIFLYDATGRRFARINFLPYKMVTAVEQDPRPFFILSYPRDEYQFVLDLLRNERPVYLQVVRADPTVVVLSTSPEPIDEWMITYYRND